MQAAKEYCERLGSLPLMDWDSDTEHSDAEREVEPALPRDARPHRPFWGKLGHISQMGL